MRIVIIILIFFISLSSLAQKTESPYLKVLTKGVTLPLKSTKASVQIVGSIAHVKIVQTYHNKSNIPLEATYIFPMSTKAAVHDMKMMIGNRSINAKIYEKKKATKIYSQAIKKGKRVSKLEQLKPNIFQMNVGNIMPNDLISIELFYTEMLTPIEGNYQFIFPGVVGPRFTGEKKSINQSFAIPYTSSEANDMFSYELNVCISSGMIIQSVNSVSHNVKVHYPDALTAEISLASNSKNPANRDFILNYTTRNNKIQSGLMLYEGDKENFFSLMIEPPKNIQLEMIPPREYFFIVDVSGSMMGYPIGITKSLLKNLLADLKETDVFNILLFSAENKIFKKSSVIATKKHIQEAFQFLTGTFSNYGKGTYLLNALKKAYKMPRKFDNSSRTMIVITDGYVNVEKEAFQIIENNLNNANVVSFGIGNSVNRYLIEGMANAGKSESFIATSKEEAHKIAKDFKTYISSPLLTQIKYITTHFDTYDIEPSSIPDVFADRPIMVYGKYRGEPKGIIKLTGYQGNKKIVQNIHVKNGRLSKDHKALKYLWARKRIERLDDYNTLFRDDVKEQIITLGLKYNLATNHTSFVAVDNEIVRKKGAIKTIQQPLPFAKGVSYPSVGVEAIIKGKTIVRKGFSIIVNNNTNIDQKNKILAWLKINYGLLIEKYLKKYKKIRIIVNKKGIVTGIQRENKNNWIIDNTLFPRITTLPNSLKINKDVIITIY